ncbi:MAG: hypothetical protein SGPRY_014683 [Prymnesium sp.]
MLLQGTAGLGYGLIEGAVGLVREPYKGARKEGASGFVKGVGKGLVGAAIRPTAGVAKLTHRWAGALQQATGESEANSTHSARVGRVRPPRMLHGLGKRIAPYSIAEALARHVLLSTLLPADYDVAMRIPPSEGEWQFREAAMVSFHMRQMKPHFPRQEEGKYTHEPLLHCALLGEEGRSETVMIATLTGLRLLTVDTTTWRVNLNLPLRKAAELRTGECTEEAMRSMLLHVQKALLLRTRKRIWYNVGVHLQPLHHLLPPSEPPLPFSPTLTLANDSIEKPFVGGGGGQMLGGGRQQPALIIGDTLDLANSFVESSVPAVVYKLLIKNLLERYNDENCVGLSDQWIL